MSGIGSQQASAQPGWDGPSVPLGAISAPTAESHPPPKINVLQEREISVSARILALRQEMSAAFAVIKTQLSQTPSLVLHVISSREGEGTSTVARELAFAAASVGWCRVLLLDGNAGSDDQAKRFGWQALPDVARIGGNGLELDVMRVTTSTSAFDLASLAIGGARAISQTEPGVLRSLYRNLRSAYTLTIIDCPSVMGSPDSVSLSEYADGIIFVIEAEKTRVPVITHAREEIETAGGTITGIVLNKRKQYIPKMIYRLL